MSFIATKKEWSEIYTVFRLLADAFVYLGTPEGKPHATQFYPIVALQRVEHNGEREYRIEGVNIHIVGEEVDLLVPRNLFSEKADEILTLISSKDAVGGVESSEQIERFLDSIQLFDLEAKTQDRTDFHLIFFDKRMSPLGVSLFSRIGKQKFILDGGRTANLKLELVANKFSVPTVQNINAESEGDDVFGVAKRMNMIERLGGLLKYADVSDRVFRCNLFMLDLHLPRLLAEMLRYMHLDGIVKIKDLVREMEVLNPLKVKTELIEKHHYYEHKIKDFLLTSALGMRPAKIYDGEDSAIGAIMLLDAKGKLMLYPKTNRELMRDFLYQNTRFLKGSTVKDHYGYLERENGVYYFKLNIKIGLSKR